MGELLGRDSSKGGGGMQSCVPPCPPRLRSPWCWGAELQGQLWVEAPQVRTPPGRSHKEPKVGDGHLTSSVQGLGAAVRTGFPSEQEGRPGEWRTWLSGRSLRPV